MIIFTGHINFSAVVNQSKYVIYFKLSTYSYHFHNPVKIDICDVIYLRTVNTSMKVRNSEHTNPYAMALKRINIETVQLQVVFR
jgi:hypothetical protein